MTKASHGAPRQKQSAYRFHNCRWDNLWLMKTTNGDTRVLDAPKKKSVALGLVDAAYLTVRLAVLVTPFWVARSKPWLTSIQPWSKR